MAIAKKINLVPKTVDPVAAVRAQFRSLPADRQREAIDALLADYKVLSRQRLAAATIDKGLRPGDIVQFTKGKGWAAETKYMRVHNFKRDLSGVIGYEVADAEGTPRTGLPVKWTVAASLVTKVA